MKRPYQPRQASIEEMAVWVMTQTFVKDCLNELDEKIESKGDIPWQT